MLGPAQLLRNWSEQGPSNQGDLDFTITGGFWECVLHCVDLLLIALRRSTELFWGFVLKKASCILQTLKIEQKYAHGLGQKCGDFFCNFLHATEDTSGSISGFACCREGVKRLSCYDSIENFINGLISAIVWDMILALLHDH
jgi:hypothetical protein